MQRISGRLVLVLLFSVVFFLNGCDPTGLGDDPASIEIDASRSTLELLGDTVQLTAVVKSEGGKVLPNASVTWASRRPAVARVSESGVVMGRGNGRAWIVASSGAARDSMRITVDSPIECMPVGEIALPDTVSGSLATTDCRIEEFYVDVWVLRLEAETELTIQLRSSAFDALLVLANAHGEFIGWDDDSGGGTDSRLTITLPTGAYYIHATSYGSDQTGAYQLMAQEGVPPSPCPATGTVPFPGTVTGATSATGCVLNGFYLDVWRVDVPEDTVVIVQVDSDDFRPAFLVSDTFGRTFGGSWWGTGTRAWLQIPLTVGSYDIWVGTLDEPGVIGAYTLSVRAGPIYRVCESVGTLEFPGSVTGELTDDDCFVHMGTAEPWDMEISETAEINLSVVTPDGFYPAIIVTDDAGAEEVVFWGNETGAEGVVTLPAGSYRVWVAANADWQEAPSGGTYTLSAHRADQMMACEPDGHVAVEDSVTGALSSTDCQFPDGRYADVWTTRLDTAATIRVTLNSTKFDAFLIVADSAGTRIALDDDGGLDRNAMLTLQLEAGLYQLWATSYYPESMGEYVLGVSTVESGGALSMAAVRPSLADKEAQWMPSNGVGLESLMETKDRGNLPRWRAPVMPRVWVSPPAEKAASRRPTDLRTGGE